MVLPIARISLFASCFVYISCCGRFEPSTGAVSWPRVAAANVNKIEREGDLQSLRQFLPDVAVGRVDEEDVDTHPGLLKAFRLAQLQAQYLLHCQQVRYIRKTRQYIITVFRGSCVWTVNKHDFVPPLNVQAICVTPYRSEAVMVLEVHSNPSRADPETGFLALCSFPL